MYPAIGVVRIPARKASWSCDQPTASCFGSYGCALQTPEPMPSIPTTDAWGMALRGYSPGALRHAASPATFWRGHWLGRAAQPVMRRYSARGCIIPVLPPALRPRCPPPFSAQRGPPLGARSRAHWLSTLRPSQCMERAPSWGSALGHLGWAHPKPSHAH